MRGSDVDELRDRVLRAHDPTRNALFSLLRAVLDEDGFRIAVEYARCELEQGVAETACEIETGREVDLHDLYQPPPELVRRFLEVCERAPATPAIFDRDGPSVVARLVVVTVETACEALRAAARAEQAGL